MFKPELWQSHDEYRTIVYTYGRRLSRNNTRYSFDLYDKERQKLLDLNLDAVPDYITRCYSDGDALPKTRRRSCAPSSFSSCFSTRLRPKQA